MTVTQRPMPNNWITMTVGWSFLVLGLFSAFAPLGTGRVATVGSFAGPAGLVVFGWLALVPRVYSGISVKGFVASMVAYALLFLGTFALMQSQDSGKIIPLYAGMIALAYGAKKRDPMLRANARKLYGDPAAQALSSDTLFVYVAVLVLLLAVFTLREQPVTMGLVGHAAQQLLFNGLARAGRGFGLLKSGLELLIGNFQIEYYAYCVASLFWLASDSTPHDRKIPPRAASWAILLTGVAILVMGILGLFRSNGVLSLMVGATIGSLVGATVMFIADRQLGIRSALALTRRGNLAPLPAYASPASLPVSLSTSATAAPTPQTPAVPATPQPQTPLKPGESPLPPYMQ